MANPEIRSFDSDTICIANPVYKNVLIKNTGLGLDVMLFRGLVLCFRTDIGFWGPTISGISVTANAKGVLTSTLTLLQEETKLIRILVGGEVYSDRLLFASPEADNLLTIPPGGTDSFLLQLRDNNIIVKSGENIAGNDFPGCEIIT